jgi:hypothetical protein
LYYGKRKVQKEEKCIYNTIIESTALYGCELKKKYKRNTGFGNGLLA